MTESSPNSITSEEAQKMIEYILGLEKRTDKLLDIVPSEDELEDDDFGIDDAFEKYSDLFFYRHAWIIEIDSFSRRGTYNCRGLL